MAGNHWFSGPITVTGFTPSRLETFKWHFASLGEGYYSISDLFWDRHRPFDPSAWNRRSICVRDQYGAFISAEAVIEALQTRRREIDRLFDEQRLRRMGLTEAQGYRFRQGPIKTRSIARRHWWRPERKRRLRAMLQTVIEQPEELEVDPALLRHDIRRSKKALAVWGDLFDEEFPIRNTSRNWKAFRKRQWR
jgi:hypothetical protein